MPFSPKVSSTYRRDLIAKSSQLIGALGFVFLVSLNMEKFFMHFMG